MKDYYFYPRKEELIRREVFNFNIQSKPFLIPRKWLKNSYISFFYKTPKNIVCPHFWLLKPFIGCPYECSYCYLQGTFFGDKKPKLKDLEKMVKTLKEFFSWSSSIGINLLLCVGELADCLAIPKWTEIFLEKTIPIMEKYPGNKLLFLSKAGKDNIYPLLDDDQLKKFLIVSFSVNPQKVVEKFERRTACLKDRLEAMRMIQKKGYKIRIRIDPMIPIENWEFHYSELTKAIFDEFKLKPERITIGSLRGLKKTMFYAKDKSWISYLDEKEKTGWGLKIRKDLRISLYATVLEEIRKHGFNEHLALCKETPDIWEILAKKNLLPFPGSSPSWENVRCNCKF
jgi:spore photoproduct lyase